MVCVIKATLVMKYHIVNVVDVVDVVDTVNTVNIAYVVT